MYYLRPKYLTAFQLENVNKATVLQAHSTDYLWYMSLAVLTRPVSSIFLQLTSSLFLVVTGTTCTGDLSLKSCLHTGSLTFSTFLVDILGQL